MTEPSRFDKKLLQETLRQAIAALPAGDSRATLELIYDDYQKLIRAEEAQNLAQNQEVWQSKVDIATRLGELTVAHGEGELAKQGIAQSELLFRTMCEASPELIWTADGEGMAQYFNAQFLQFSGLSGQQLSHHGWFDLIHGEEREQAEQRWKSCLQKGEKFEIEMRLRQFDGQYRWFLVRSLPIKNQAAEPLSWCGSCTDIDTHRNLISELKSARDQAEAALKVKSEFVANVSHELRTPLNGILGMVEVLLRGELSPKSKEHVTIIREAGGSLLSIINDILDFSKIEAGKMELSTCQFDPLALVEGVAEIMVRQAAAKNLLLLATVDRTVPDLVYGDPQRLRQVLVNLCGNAIKFTDQGQIVIKVEVTTNSGVNDCTTDGAKEKSKNELLFSVFDSGIGISEQFQRRLFEPFMQAEGSAYRSTGGTGLGLSISKHLVELMGGHLFVNSKQDIGSIFSFSIPLKTNTENSNTDFSERAWELTYASMNLLTLEPSHKDQSVICAHLSALGIAVQTTDSAKEALRLLESKRSASEKFQALILDTVRYKKECKEFLDLFKRSSVFGLVNIIEVAAPEAFTQERTTLLAPRTSHLAIPLRRKQVAACLDNLKGWKPKTRTPHTQTMEVDCVIVQDPLTTAKLKIDQTLVEKPKARSKSLRRALVADDNKINQQVASLFLQDLGFVVDLTADGTEAVSAFKAKPYDMVFLDCQMPVLDGFEACKIIKEIQQRRGQRVPIIAVTANAIEGSREECLARGMDDYLSKPIDPIVMSKVVARWLGTSDFKITLISPEQSAQNISTDMDLTLHTSYNERNRVGESLIDLSQLRLRFNTKNMHNILRMFKDNSSEELAEIESYIDSNDMRALKIKAHGLASACNIICSSSMARVCLALEQAAAVNSEYTGELAATLKKLMAKAAREIGNELMQQSTTG